ncbi:MAG TPA: isoprenylcysteine carboxylmethyltransferase family protein [Ktedonosporobacter sp.]|jgi:protein-S-isoprenylcysteine O-methyltransferase Ste14|nr:isoprenylcysteine carboxylmethyltransferase family protein [Ktedonosporobacter sp.]
MLPLIYTNITYTLIFLLTSGSWAAMEFFGPMRWRGSGEARKRDQGSFTVMVISSLLGSGLCFLLPLLLPGATIGWNQPLVFFIGFALTLSGLAWRLYAIKTLGRYFTGTVTIHPNQPVVQHGPYKLIRHPSYTGILLSTLGVGVMIMNWVSILIIIVGSLPGFLYRISVEERALREHIGQPYVEYMQRTKRLIPFIY